MEFSKQPPYYDGKIGDSNIFGTTILRGAEMIDGRWDWLGFNLYPRVHVYCKITSFVSPCLRQILGLYIYIYVMCIYIYICIELVISTSNN